VNLVDSSGWLEFYANGPNAASFAAPIRDRARLIVPSIVILEVRRRLLQQAQSVELVDEAVAAMRRHRVVDLDFELAVLAADLGVALKLPPADSVILSAARLHNALLWTQDAHFQGMEGVKFVKKR
jgi:predicted nucleic acid-binding protein